MTQNNVTKENKNKLECNECMLSLKQSFNAEDYTGICICKLKIPSKHDKLYNTHKICFKSIEQTVAVYSTFAELSTLGTLSFATITSELAELQNKEIMKVWNKK